MFILSCQGLFYVFFILQNKKAVGNEAYEKPPYRNQVSNMFIVQLNNFPKNLFIVTKL